MNGQQHAYDNQTGQALPRYRTAAQEQQDRERLAAVAKAITAVRSGRKKHTPNVETASSIENRLSMVREYTLGQLIDLGFETASATDKIKTVALARRALNRIAEKLL